MVRGMIRHSPRWNDAIQLLIYTLKIGQSVGSATTGLKWQACNAAYSFMIKHICFWLRPIWRNALCSIVTQGQDYMSCKCATSWDTQVTTSEWQVSSVHEPEQDLHQPSTLLMQLIK